MRVNSEMLYANVSALVSAGDGFQYDFVGVQPPPLPTPPFTFTGGAGVSCPAIDMLEFMRRCVTKITTPSTTIVSGTAAGAVAVTLGLVAPSGITGLIQGFPFSISAAGTTSAALGASAVTTSTQIRKVFVTLGLSALPVGLSGFSLAGGAAVQFVYGSAMTTSALACTSGSQAYSYWDYVPLPLPSAHEIPIGWITVPNSSTAAQATINSCMFTDYRVTQGLNMSAMLQGRAQP